jgi:hypothetical protein
MQLLLLHIPTPLSKENGNKRGRVAKNTNDVPQWGGKGKK